MKKYYLYSDNNKLIMDYLEEQKIFYDYEFVLDYDYYIILYTYRSVIKKIKRFAKSNGITINISRFAPDLPIYLRPSYEIISSIFPSFRIIKKMEKNYLKYLSSNPKDPINECDYIYDKLSKL